MPRIALIHATRVAIDPIEVAAQSLWPEAEMISILEEGLSTDRASGKASMHDLNARIVNLARYAEGLQPDGILYTCSAFGRGIEEAASTSALPVLKPNEAMFERAFAEGNDIAMVYTFAPAAEGMEDEFRKEAESRNSSAKLRTIYAEGALDALKSGDVDTHNRLVAEAANTAADADAILLAHFSMARAAGAVRSIVDRPILTSPEAAIEKMKATLNSA